MVWTAVSTWFNDSVVVPVTGFFTGLWEGIKTAASGAWDGIKVIWEGAVTFFQTSIVDPVVASFSSIWAGITGAFQDVSTWFEENVFGPIRSVVPGWLLNLFGGGASATVTVVDNRNQPGPGSTDGGTDKPAAGIKRVPFDNYPALLHKGETVLPSGEAGEYRRQGNMSGKAANNISLNITVNGGNMDEERLASILVNRLQEAALNMA